MKLLMYLQIILNILKKDKKSQKESKKSSSSSNSKKERVVNYYEGQMVSSGSIYSKNETIKMKKYEKK